MKHARKWCLGVTTALILALSLCGCNREDGEISGDGSDMAESSSSTTTSTTNNTTNSTNNGSNNGNGVNNGNGSNSNGNSGTNNGGDSSFDILDPLEPGNGNSGEMR